MKVTEVLGTDCQEVHITLAPENEAEAALLRILGDADGTFSSNAETSSTEANGLLITARIKGRSLSKSHAERG